MEHIDRLGFRFEIDPEREPDDIAYNEETGMEFEIYWEDALDEILVGACHEDVGLVTWYRMPAVMFPHWAGLAD